MKNNSNTKVKVLNQALGLNNKIEKNIVFLFSILDTHKTLCPFFNILTGYIFNLPGLELSIQIQGLYSQQNAVRRRTVSQVVREISYSSWVTGP